MFDALQAVHFLDFVHQVLLQFLLAQNMQDVVRIARPVHQRLADANALAFLHLDVDAAGDRIIHLLAVIAEDRNPMLAPIQSL